MKIKKKFTVSVNYSALKDSTGSFLDAIRDGISPPINVSTTLIIISITAPPIGREHMFLTPATAFIMALIGIFKMIVAKIPIMPDAKPMIKVSALNTRETSFFEAPIARRIPISLVRSKTEIYVIIPIIIDETMSEIDTNPIRT